MARFDSILAIMALAVLASRTDSYSVCVTGGSGFLGSEREREERERRER